MPRIRSLKPEIASDVKLASVSRDARYTFVLLITQADDSGLVAAAHRQLIGTLYPLDDDVTVSALLVWIEELVESHLIRWRATRDGVPVLEIVNWEKHQRIDNAGRSQLGALLEPISVNPTDPAPDSPPGGSRRFAAVRGGSRLGSPITDLGSPITDSPAHDVADKPRQAKPAMRKGSVSPIQPTLQAIAPIWESRFGIGSFPWGKAGSALKGIARNHDPPTIAAHLERYLATTDPKYLSLANFAERFAQYAPLVLAGPEVEDGWMSAEVERLTRPSPHNSS